VLGSYQPPWLVRDLAWKFRAKLEPPKDAFFLFFNQVAAFIGNIRIVQAISVGHRADPAWSISNPSPG